MSDLPVVSQSLWQTQDSWPPTTLSRLQADPPANAPQWLQPSRLNASRGCHEDKLLSSCMVLESFG